MSRVLKGLGALVLAGGALILVWDWNWFKDVITGKAQDYTGRELHMDGDLDVDLSWRPLITMEGLRLENASWGSTEDMLRIDRLAVRLDLKALFQGRVVLPDIRLLRPVVVLEKTPEGEANWRFNPDPLTKAAQEAVTPDERAEIPVVLRLVLEDGRLDYRDPGQDTELALRLNSVLGGADSAQDRMDILGEGRLQGQPLTLTLSAGAPERLRDEDQPYPLKTEIKIGDTLARAEGTLTRPLELGGVDLDLRLKGPDPALLFPLLGIPLPSLPPYDIRGQLLRDGDVWRFREFTGSIGDSDISGTVAVDSGGDRLAVTADLTSRKLDFDDLAGLVGAAPDPEETASRTQARQAEAQAAGDRALPDKPIDLSRLRAADARIRFQGKQVIAPDLPLEDIQVEAELDGGRLRLDPLQVGVGGGTLTGAMTLDARDELPRFQLKGHIRSVDLQQVLAPVDIAKESFGRIGGQFQLDSAGVSTARILGSADGELSLVMTGGQIDSLLIEAMGLDAGEILGVLLAEDRNVPIRCAVADFQIERGIMRARALVLDTSDSQVLGEGRVDLAAETLDLTLNAQPKDVSLFTARSPIRVTGSFREPSVAPEVGPLLARGAVAVALGALATPAAALLALVEPGGGEDSDCQSLLAETEQP